MAGILIASPLVLGVLVGLLFGEWRELYPNKPWFQFVNLMQTGLGALIGFYGLMAVEAVRIRNERRRDVHRQKAEAKAIGMLLDWETGKLMHDLQDLRGNLDTFTRPEDPHGPITLTEGVFQRILPPPAEVFGTVLDRLGAVERAVLEKVLWFFERYNEVRAATLSQLGTTGQRTVPASHVDAIRDTVEVAIQAGRDPRTALGAFLQPDQRLLDARSRLTQILAHAAQQREKISASKWTGIE